MKKKIIGVLLALCMAVCVMLTTAWAHTDVMLTIYAGDGGMVGTSDEDDAAWAKQVSIETSIIGDQLKVKPDLGYEVGTVTVVNNGCEADYTLQEVRDFEFKTGVIEITIHFNRTEDTEKPVISGVEEGKTYCNAQTVTITEDYLSSVTINGKEVTLDENNQFTLSPASGAQTIVATDVAGNTAAVTVTVNDGHSYGKWQSNGNGTHSWSCTVEGCSATETEACSGGTATCTKQAVCKDCGQYYGKTNPHNHPSLQHVSATAATTEMEGNIEYWYCPDCAKYFSDSAATVQIRDTDTVIEKLKEEAKPEESSEAEKETGATETSTNTATAATTTETAVTAKVEAASEKTSPKTADGANVAAYAAVMTVSAGALVGAVAMSKKKRNG